MSEGGQRLDEASARVAMTGTAEVRCPFESETKHLAGVLPHRRCSPLRASATAPADGQSRGHRRSTSPPRGRHSSSSRPCDRGRGEARTPGATSAVPDSVRTTSTRSSVLDHRRSRRRIPRGADGGSKTARPSRRSQSSSPAVSVAPSSARHLGRCARVVAVVVGEQQVRDVGISDDGASLANDRFGGGGRNRNRPGRTNHHRHARGTRCTRASR